ncbi:MAG: tetratricopeptide repeat protein [Bacteroidia bacterium]
MYKGLKILYSIVLAFSCFAVFSQQQTIDSLRKELKKDNSSTGQIIGLTRLSGYYKTYNIDSAYTLALRATKLAEKEKPGTYYYAVAIEALAEAYYFKLDKTNRDSCIKISIDVFSRIKDSCGLCDAKLKNAGYLKFDGDMETSLKKYIEVNKESAKAKCFSTEAWSDHNIGEIYIDLNKFKEALEYALLSFQKMKKLNHYRGMSQTSSNVGLIYDITGNPDSALHYYAISIESAKKEHLEDVMANTYSNMGVVYFYKGDYENAIKQYKLALELNNKLDYDESKGNNLLNLGEVYEAKKEYTLAEKYMLEGLAILGKTKNMLYRKEAYRMIGQLYSEMGKYDKAYGYHLKFSEISDSLYNQNSTKAVAEMQVKFDTEKKQQEIEIQNAKLDSQKAQLKEEQFQRLALYLGLGLLVVLGAFIYNRLTVTRKQKAEVEIQKKEVEKQKYIIEEHQKEIVDSINYAKRIQVALLAHEELLNNNLPAHFVLFKPKDIVSGDFYWATHTHSKENTDLFYLAVCDSTGHGVPGAFMSLLNIGFLSEAIKEKDIFKPHEVLNYVRNRLISSIGQDNQKDGMDAILIKIDENELRSHKEILKVEYAAANNEPILIRDNKIIELPKDKMPVGKGEKTDSFTLHQLELRKGDCLYLYTDGYADQFGGEKGKKFKYKQLNELLLANHTLPPDQQREILVSTFEKWKGNLEQVDDVCIIGIKI